MPRKSLLIRDAANLMRTASSQAAATRELSPSTSRRARCLKSQSVLTAWSERAVPSIPGSTQRECFNHMQGLKKGRWKQADPADSFLPAYSCRLGMQLSDWKTFSGRAASKALEITGNEVLGSISWGPCGQGVSGLQSWGSLQQQVTQGLVWLAGRVPQINGGQLY